jgi:hypothetical protein
MKLAVAVVVGVEALRVSAALFPPSPFLSRASYRAFIPF